MPSLTLAEMIIPPLPFVVALGWMAVRKTRLQSWRRAEGVVIEMVPGLKRTMKPRVRFASELGRTAVFTGRIGSRPPSYAVGQAVPVLYDPGQPERAIIDTFWERWGAELVFAILALLFFPNLLYAAVHHLGW